MPGPGASTATLHASCIDLNGQGVLILGTSGSGKSGLAIQLMALGAGLVADDRTIVQRRDGTLIAFAPDSIRGQIEARKIGILAANPAGKTRIRFAIDMDVFEADRLPQFHKMQLLGVTLPLIRRSKEPHFEAAIYLLLKGGRIA